MTPIPNATRQQVISALRIHYHVRRDRGLPSTGTIVRIATDNDGEGAGLVGVIERLAAE